MGRIDKEEIGHRQQLVLKCVWSLGGKATVPQIVDLMEEKYGTRLTGQGMNTSVMLLVQKGLLKKGRKIHQAFIYEATISEEAFRIRELERIQKLTFDGSSKAMMASFLNTKLAKEELEEIREMLEEKEK